MRLHRPDYPLQARLLWDWRPTRLAILRRSILTILVASLALALTAYILPGLRIDGPGAILLGGALLAAAMAGVRLLLLHWLLVTLPIPVIQVTALAAQWQRASGTWPPRREPVPTPWRPTVRTPSPCWRPPGRSPSPGT